MPLCLLLSSRCVREVAGGCAFAQGFYQKRTRAEVMWRAWRYAPEILMLQTPGGPAAGLWRATWIRCVGWVDFAPSHQLLTTRDALRA
eukprot:5595518-Prymnesium_polylepis.1